MFWVALILLIIQYVLLISSAKSTGKASNIRFGIAILIGGVIIWIGLNLNTFNTPKELTNHSSETRE